MSGADVRFREATAADLPSIVRLLADDPLGSGRESVADPLPASYGAAFAAIEASPGERLVVADLTGRVVGCLQLSVIPNLSHAGTPRGQIEGVRIAADLRGGGLGERLIRHAVDLARAAGCGMVQLTSDLRRTDAIRFYERLGFRNSHAGMKLRLD